MINAACAIAMLWMTNNASGQDLAYARSIVDSLASPAMHGRGYVQKGDLSAATYISSEFERLGLRQYDSSYFQYFDLPVNTFPGTMILGVNDVPLVPGVDYLVSADCPDVLGEFEVVYLSAKEIVSIPDLISGVNRAQERFIVIDLDEQESLAESEKEPYMNNLNLLKFAIDIRVSGIIQLTSDKLTWSVSPVQATRPSITIRKESLKEPIKSVIVHVEAELFQQYKTQNVLGYIPGTAQSDSLLVFTAHYDHLGRMGTRTFFPGANDNASGVAMLLTLAQHYMNADNAPKYGMAFIAFAGEEAGLKGSGHFVENPVFSLEKIKFLVNFDISGTGDDGIQVVNGTVFRSEFDRLKAINDESELLPQVKIRGEACNSDHCHFHQKGVPSFFIYTLGGIQAYHDIFDKAETLPLTTYPEYFQLLTRWISEF